MEHIASRLAAIPGVVAVTLGGSQATGRHRPDSDWDFGLYYRGTIDAADVRALGWPGEVTGPGGWGPVVNGGAWLTVDGERVDLCYRDLDEVLGAVSDAQAGHFSIYALATFVAGIPSYVPVGELALGRVLSGDLPRPGFPEALAASAPERWRSLAAMALRTASAHAERADVAATAGALGQALLAEAQARLAERREWALNEKGIIARAGLAGTGALLGSLGSSAERLTAAVSGVSAALATPAPSAPAPARSAGQMTAADVTEVLDALDQAGVTTWLDGGWGIDALAGEQTREHEDLDLAVDAKQLGRAQRALAGLGFALDRLAVPGLPARAVLRDDRARQIDLHPLTLDAAGDGWQPLGGGAWGRYPAEGLSGTGSVGGRPVSCLTAALQLTFHLGYPPRDSDRHDLNLLAQRFGVPLPPAEPADPAR
ncbi:MAG TPA: hypothetical protein VGI64_07625 [Streptosporangiaceae bacterium]